MELAAVFLFIIYKTLYFSTTREVLIKDVCSLIDITSIYAIIMRYT